jgi:glycosyltransferase involved in cell wall biosynthesis
MRVLAFTRYGPRAASTRQRLLQYDPHLRAAGIEIEHHALLPDDYVESLVTGRRYSRWRVAGNYLARIGQLRRARPFDLIWVYGDLLPFLPAVVERVAMGGGKPVVYDLDDAFFHHYDANSKPLIRHMLGGKFATLLSRAAACCCGNAYVRDYAAQFCDQSIILPTVVDTSVYQPAASKPAADPLVIGWIGSPSTWPNVRPLLPMLAQLCAERGIHVRAVGAGRAAESDRFPGLDLVDWSEATEVAEVQSMDIGIMPLLDHPFERGKSGYKLIQYMACGLPVVASPVGVNSEIVIHWENGFLALGKEEWRAAMIRLIDDPELRAQMGRRGRKQVEASYSLASQAPRLIESLRLAARGSSSPGESC